MTQSSLNYVSLGGLAILAVLFAFAAVAHANPFYTGTKAASATATTTVSFLTPGTGTTTTPIYDSYEVNGTNQTNGGNATLPNTVAILLDGVASSTASTLNIACEYSDNYNASTGNGDWYQNEIIAATSTNAVPIFAPMSYGFTFSSSTTLVGAATAQANRFQKLVTCPVPLRYVRIVVTNTGAPASVWRAIIPTKQRN